MIDLGRWVNEEYRVAGKPVPTESVDTPDAPKDNSEDLDS
jgi:endogenous inhibitor of DNA gyrase (YacG/DUF329 family)